MINALLVAGTRPNFIKVAPLYRAFRSYDGITPILVHTGQHYDAAMSDVFFEQLGIPQPDLFLKTGSGSHAAQTARIMIELEQVFIDRRPDVVVVVGDVNSTLAAALAAVKLHIPVAHVEAGLRSFDRRMPEEINRLATDAISEYLFVSEESGLRHLRSEGKAEDRMFFVGNVMIDSLRRFEGVARAISRCATYGLSAGSYVLVTAHRPELVDDPGQLSILVESLLRIGEKHPVIFPVHPRTRKQIIDTGLDDELTAADNIHLVAPLGYLEFLSLMIDAGLVLTDSGGVQEETTVLGVPCATVRDNTERPCTVEIGTNELLELRPALLEAAADQAVSGRWKKGELPELWDGHAADRIASRLADLMT